MGEKDWNEMFRVEVTNSQEEKAQGEVHKNFDHPACRRARGFKCVCGCGGAYHGSYWADQNEKLDAWTREEEGPVLVGGES